MKKKSICDTLAARGSPISGKDQLVLSILDGLGPDFEPTIVFSTSKIEAYKVKVAIALLLAYELSNSPTYQSPYVC